jgi:hypothetical protein
MGFRGVMVAVGAVGAIIAANAECDDADDSLTCDGERQIVAAGVLILYGVPGVSLLTYGFFTRASSVDRLTTIRGPKRVSGLALELAF